MRVLKPLTEEQEITRQFMESLRFAFGWTSTRMAKELGIGVERLQSYQQGRVSWNAEQLPAWKKRLAKKAHIARLRVELMQEALAGLDAL